MESRDTLGGLTVRIVAPARVAVASPSPLVILLHGFGAPGDDLVPLASEVGLPQARCVFPEGPQELPALYGGGRAWWVFDFERLEAAVQSGDMDTVAEHVPDGLAVSRAGVLGLVGEARARFESGAVVLGGFSQGAIVSLDAALYLDPVPDAIVLLSVMPVALGEWRPRLARMQGVPVFMSHGRRDPILPFALAERLRAELEAAGASVTWAPFDGGHEIPAPVRAELGAFLREVTARRGAPAPR